MTGSTGSILGLNTHAGVWILYTDGGTAGSRARSRLRSLRKDCSQARVRNGDAARSTRVRVRFLGFIDGSDRDVRQHDALDALVVRDIFQPQGELDTRRRHSCFFRTMVDQENGCPFR